MIAKQMVVRCSLCGRTFIRSVGGTQRIRILLGEPPICNRCKLRRKSRIVKKAVKKQ